MTHPNHLAKNLQALRPFNPILADLLSNFTPNPAWQPTLGRDDSPTFAQASTDSDNLPTITWLGGTSMPATSATPITQKMDLGQNNGMLLGIGSGYEPQALAQRLASAQMLFVLENRLDHLHLALQICDLSELLAAGKLLLLGGEESTALAQFQAAINNFPGLTPPEVMHPLPTLEPTHRHELLGIGERLIRPTVGFYTHQLTQTFQQLLEPWPIATPPRKILSLQVGRAYSLGRITPELATALGTLIPTEQLILDHHLTAGLLVRAQRLASLHPDLILSDLFRAQLGIPLPHTVPVYTLVPPETGAAFWVPERLPSPASLASHDRVICHSEIDRRKLLASDFTPAQILLLPLGIAPSPQLTFSPASTVSAEPPQRIALLADLPDTHPHTYGLELPTHEDLWHAAGQIIADDPYIQHAGLAQDILQRAQRRCNVTIKDPQLAKSLERGIRDILLPTLTIRALALALHQADFQLVLLGTGWEIPCDRPRYALPPGAITRPFAAPDLWSEVAVLLNYTVDAHLPPLVLAAPFAGVPIVTLHTPASKLGNGTHTGLSDLLEPGKDFISVESGQLVATLRGLLRDASRRAALATAATENLKQNHTWNHRAAALLKNTHAI